MNEQRLYARWLDWGTRIALAVLAATFLAYVLGFSPAALPLAEVPRFWTLPLDRYLALSGWPVGWGWLRLLDKGEYQNLAGVALLGLVTVVCYLRVLPALLARGQRLQAALAAAQVLVLLAAASGLFAGGH
ncbi:MAG: hypothetical protein ACT4P3_08920 [Betaproteobacteria bacterium]